MSPSPTRGEYLKKLTRLFDRASAHERGRLGQNSSVAINGRIESPMVVESSGAGAGGSGKLYKTIFDHYWASKDGGDDEARKAIAAAAEALGAEGVAALTGQKILAGQPAGITALFDTFVQYIRNPANGFTWRGTEAGGGGFKLLDNDVTSGECALFRGAFAMLCWAPRPYGLGLKREQFDAKMYSGSASMGFVCRHPAAGIMGVMPNVKGAELYVWRNHKVVRYRNDYFDVMYKTSFKAKGQQPEEQDMAQMALYQIVEETRRGDGDYAITIPVGQEKEKRRKWFREIAGTNPIQYEEGPLEAG